MKMQLKISNLSQKTEENYPTKIKSNASSPKKLTNLSPLLPPKNLSFQKNNIKTVTPKENTMRSDDFMIFPSNVKLTNDNSFLKSGSLSPKKTNNYLSRKMFSPINQQENQERPKKELITVNGFIRGGRICDFIKINQKN